MKSLLSSASCAALFFLATPALAQQSATSIGSNGDWYVSVFAGSSYLQDLDTSYVGFYYEIDFDSGFVAGATVGRRLNNNWRGEVELSYSKYKASAFSFTGGGGTASEGLDALYFLANVWYDIPTNGRLSPYVGGGVGIAHVEGDVLFSNGFGFLPSSDTAFTYQFGAGVSFPVSSRLTLDAGYRFKVISKTEFTDRGLGPNYQNGPIRSHTVQVGLRMSF
jgi:opacity protein-like surface antigen